MRLELTRSAQADLDEIRDYSLDRFGAARAIAYLDAIEQAFRRILSFPGVGAVHSAKPPIPSLSTPSHLLPDR